MDNEITQRISQLYKDLMDAGTWDLGMYIEKENEIAEKAKSLPSAERDEYVTNAYHDLIAEMQWHLDTTKM